MGFLYPAAWFFAVLYGVLIALYLFERRRRRVTVPALLLWEHVPEVITRSRRLRVDWLFVIQSVLLGLLIAGLAGPYLADASGGTAPRRRIFVLDASASMQAKEDGSTRFEMARAALRRRIGGLPVADEAMLILATDRAAVLQPFSTDRAALLRRLRGVEPGDTGTNANLALALARAAAEGADPPAATEYYTDLSPAQIDADLRDNVAFIPFGTSDDNLAIEGLQIFQGRFQTVQEVSARVLVRNFSYGDAHGLLTVDVDGEVVARRGFSLGPRAARAFAVRNFPRAGVVHAALETNDALAVDNHAYGWIRPAGTIRLLVAGPPSAMRAALEQIAGATDRLALAFVSPEQYGPASLSEADVVLFYRFLPPAAPDRPQLYIFPPEGNARFPVAGIAHNVNLLAWNEHHPVLHSLQPVFPSPFQKVAVTAPPDWADVLLTGRDHGEAIPLAFAGQPKQFRVAYITFDPAAEGILAPDNVSLLVFFLNLLDWLAPTNTAVPVLRTGESYTATDLPAKPRRLIDPRGNVSDYPPDEPLVFYAMYAGVYRLETGRVRRAVTANLFDPTESDIAKPAGPAAGSPPPSQHARPTTAERRPLDPWLYSIAALLLLAERRLAAREA